MYHSLNTKNSTSFLETHFGAHCELAERRERLGYDPDYKAQVLKQINKTRAQEPWLPSEHFNILHTHERGEMPLNRGSVVAASTINRKGEFKNIIRPQFFRKPEDRMFQATEAHLDHAIVGEEDVYFNQNGFQRFRSSQNLAYAGCHYVDLDAKDIPQLRTPQRFEYIAEVIAKLVYNGMHAPSYVMFSGRGFNLVWLTDYMIANKYNRDSVTRIWKRRQKALLDVFDTLNIKVDRAVKDVTRIFRFSSSVNSKSGAVVRPIFVSGDDYYHPNFTSSTELYASICDALEIEDEPLPPATRPPAPILDQIPMPSPDQFEELVPSLQIDVVEDARPISQPKPKAKSGNPGRHISSWGQVVHADLKKLIEHRYHNGTIAEGLQDELVFIATSVAIATLDIERVDIDEQRNQNDLAYEIFEEFAAHTEYDKSHLFKKMKSAFDRLTRARAGDTVTWNGMTTDTRYRFKAATIVERLQVREDEMVSLGLRALINDNVRLKHDRERKAASRNQQSAPVSREERAEQRAKRHQQIVDSFLSIKTIKRTAEVLSCSRNTVRKVLLDQGVFA